MAACFRKSFFCGQGSDPPFIVHSWRKTLFGIHAVPDGTWIELMRREHGEDHHRRKSERGWAGSDHGKGVALSGSRRSANS